MTNKQLDDLYLMEQDVQDFKYEVINIKENLEWLENKHDFEFSYEDLLNCIKMAPPKQDINNETDFVDANLLQEILQGKEIFNELSQMTLCKARARANPFEKIKNVFFMNRAALKMANIDAATNFMFTNIDYDPRHKNPYSPYFFADVCAGPGGFTEYILWRKKWCFKGFGFTLKGQHDFKLNESTCISPNTFQAYYGAAEDGDICNLDNIRDFKSKVFCQTGGLGVHFMMADGGFSVEGNENLQEVLSKQLYTCQCLMALEIVRPGGHFVTKLFDLFTKFSVGLLYLMHQCFEYVAILKPNSSRPANSERYLIGKYLKHTKTTSIIKKYLNKIVYDLCEIKKQSIPLIDIEEIVSNTMLKENVSFFNYICKSNNLNGLKQSVALKKLALFGRNPSLIDPRQEKIRDKCLEFWRIPNKPRIPDSKLNIEDFIQNTLSKPEFMLVSSRKILNFNQLIETINFENEWFFIPLASCYKNDYCHFYASVSNSKVFKLQKNKWVKTKNIRLNKGSLVYGELVKEESILENDEKSEQISLQIIDALRLENTSLADLPFQERLVCIKTFCQALNFEGCPNNIRIRAKSVIPLKSIDKNQLINFNHNTNRYETSLDVLGFNSKEEHFFVNSILLMNGNQGYSFDTTYVLRVQVFINESENDKSIPFEKILDYKQKCNNVSGHQ
ncbi:cap-specific mRNA (nucleoside-2'-O-)-methyltransferase 1 [Onthophagus taurus]|uniref:cap-specific mRNA (nucleoside-2'-O-)-methyltransferase 1 n=1 Tax=Onthophagus taurus TaxID=166361 RepID=UPI0039BDE929